MTKKATIRTLTLLTGLVTALAIVISQLFYFAAPQHVKEDVKTEQGSSQSTDDDAVISLPSSTLPSSPACIEFQSESFCLFEIRFEEEEIAEIVSDFKLPLGKLFQTLFEAIISPNAP